MAFLCTLVLTLMAVTLPAEAANQIEGELSVPGISCTYDSDDGYGGLLYPRENKRSCEYTWNADNKTITGTVKPQEYYYKYSSSYNCYEGASSTLTITNKSGKECRLTFSYTVPANGTLSINGGNNRLTEGSYDGTLAHGKSVTVTLTTPTKTDWHKKEPCQEMYTATAKLSNITLAPLDQTVSVEFVEPTNGSYTAKIGSESLTIPQTCIKPVSTTYTLQATAAEGYFFDGWYVNNVLASRELTYTTAFAANSRVEARFVDDPLLYIIQMSDPTLAKSSYVEVDSDYYHNVKGSNHTNVGDTNINNSYGPSTPFPDSRWSTNGSGGITSSTDYKENGVATGDNQTSLGFSQAGASLYSDIIRVKCKENCIISFDSSMTAKSQWIQNSGSSDDQYGVFLYYYASPKEKETANTIKANGTAVIKNSYKGSLINHTVKDSASGTQVVVNKGEYLYLYAYARTRYDEVSASGYAKNEYSYSASISNFTVTPNNETFQFTTRNTDNTGAALAGGTVSVNGVGKDVSKAAYTPDLAKGTVLTLTPGNAPTGYTFIGWHNVTDKEYDYTNNTYTVTLTRNLEVNPIYVPVMTIMTGDGANGYENATYEYKNLSNQTVTPTDLFVARGPIPDSGNPKFYTTLKDAFATESTVFLLAGDIINGDLTIPKGKTLVIPDRFAAKGPDLQTGLPEQYDPSASISSYCKVSYSGNLTVEGTLVVNARQSGAAGGVCGRATGSIGYLSLSDGSTITVKNGGSLFGYGLIRGGSITAESNSTVRELMEISDMRSALVMKEIYDQKGSMKVFPFSNFSIKSIESRATYQTDAKLYAQYSVSMEGNNKSTGAAPLFAKTGALFNLTKGSMTKYFDPTTYKTVYRVDENSTMGTGFFQLNVKFAVGEQNAELTIDTKEYWMPLNAGFDLRTAGDMTVNGDFKFLPGASLSVEKGGTCTVANGVNLLFYRLNDYDTRGIVQGIYQKGYSSKAYPVNATKLPDGPKPPTDLSKIGSARLNVDGEMIVKGGLYVSNELVSASSQGFTTDEPVDGSPKSRQAINQAYFKLYPNGYNVLTGTGAIDMTAAQTSEPKVYEAMTSTNTNDPAWAPIPISPIKGLAENAEADNPDNYQPLKEATTYYGVYRPGGFYTWTTEKPVIAKIVGGSETTTYRSLAAAVAAYDGTNGYIQMIENSTEPGFTVDRNVTLDLNGKTVTLAGDLTVAEGKTLYGMDSTAGKDYVTAPSGKIVGKVTGTVAPVFEKPLTGDAEYNYLRYVAIKNEEGTEYTFHRFNISVTGYRFELTTGGTPQCALFFIGKFQGDDAAKAYLKSLGFKLKDIDDKITNPRYEIPAGTKIPPESDPGDSPVVLSDDGAYFFEAYLMREIDKSNPNTYQKPFSATAQATFKNDETQDSETKQWSFEDAWKNAEGLTPEQKAILKNFLPDLNISNP